MFDFNFMESFEFFFSIINENVCTCVNWRN